MGLADTVATSLAACAKVDFFTALGIESIRAGLSLEIAEGAREIEAAEYFASIPYATNLK